MNALIRRPSRSDWALMGIFWMLALVFIISSLWKQGWEFALLAGLWEALSHTGLVLLLVYGLFPICLANRQYWLLFIGMFATLLVSAVAYRVVLSAICACELSMAWPFVLDSLATMARQAGILGAVLVGKHYFEAQQRLIQSEKERTEAELRHLKAQIDPHFLFNNLNVLGSLIQRNPEQASAYLHRFSALYRYLIRHKDDDVVPLADELAFVADYQYLIRQRFGGAYVFIEKLAIADTLAVFVPPGSIQTLLENAVKHNGGNEQNPLLIELIVTEETVTVRNDLRPKLTPVESTGTGLENLRKRYRLLSDQPVLVQQDAVEFVVTLPIIQSLAFGVIGH